MREIRQSGSEGGGNEQTVSPYPYVLPASSIAAKVRPSLLFLYLNFPSEKALIRGLGVGGRKIEIERERERERYGASTSGLTSAAR